MELLLGSWVVPCGAVGAVLIAAWLVEAKQSVIENMAPVLTRLFTPLFVLMLLSFLATMLWTGSAIDVEREVLIGFDLLLALVLGLVLYAISARDPGAPPGAFDGLQLVLIAAALLVDALALWAIAARISSFGFSPNRVAALGGERDPAGEPGRRGVAGGAVPEGTCPLRGAGALADGPPARLRGLGVAGGGAVPGGLRVPLTRPPGPGRRAGPPGL